MFQQVPAILRYISGASCIIRAEQEQRRTTKDILVCLYFVKFYTNSTRNWQVLNMQNLVLLAALVFIPGVTPYPYGPPLGACMSMFPKGHGVDAQKSLPPFEILVNSTSYREADVIQSKYLLYVKTFSPITISWLFIENVP